MTDQNDKWKMFKNYMHNELAISKSDIEVWVKDSVYEIAERFVKNNLSEDQFHRHVKKCIAELVAELGEDRNVEVHSIWGDKNLKELIAREVMSHVKVKIDIKE